MGPGHEGGRILTWEIFVLVYIEILVCSYNVKVNF
jgi:hypothetical protein